MLDIVKLFGFLLRISNQIGLARFRIIMSVLAGLASGIGYTAMVALLNRVLAEGPSARRLYLFIALCMLVPASRLTSQAVLNALSARSVFELRLQLCKRILATPLRRLEELGSHRLLASLTDDVTLITNALVLVPVLCMHIAILSACLAYMGWLSWRLLFLILGCMGIGMITYQLPLRWARTYLSQLRDQTDVMFYHFRGLTLGSKELKLHRRRREHFAASALVPTGETMRRLTFLGNTIFTTAAVWGNLLFFIAMGTILFSAGRFGVDSAVLSGYVLVLLYMATPLEVLFQSLPNLSRAAASARKLEQLGIELGSVAGASTAGAPLEGIGPHWSSLELVDVAHSYRSEDGRRGFNLGPLNLSFQPGEIVFFIGGNGSGKTTLAKIITGLYHPEGGEIRLDGRVIDDSNRDDYRQLFSAIFSDFFLFESLLGLDRAGLDEAAEEYLQRLQLENKVKVEDGMFSTLDLSQGQRKRLALLVAYMEDRPIYFFDEWAADQDPYYKKIFYLELLPELRAKGKTVFVISHDDQYYRLGDRLIKLNYGQVEWEQVGTELPAAQSR